MIPRFIYPLDDPLRALNELKVHVACLEREGLFSRVKFLIEKDSEFRDMLNLKCPLKGDFLGGDQGMEVSERLEFFNQEVLALQSPIRLGEVSGVDVVPFGVHIGCIVDMGLMESVIDQIASLPENYKDLRFSLTLDLERLLSLNDGRSKYFKYLKLAKED